MNRQGPSEELAAKTDHLKPKLAKLEGDSLLLLMLVGSGPEGGFAVYALHTQAAAQRPGLIKKYRVVSSSALLACHIRL